jgi:hypothetical protein
LVHNVDESQSPKNKQCGSHVFQLVSYYIVRHLYICGLQTILMITFVKSKVLDIKKYVGPYFSNDTKVVGKCLVSKCRQVFCGTKLGKTFSPKIPGGSHIVDNGSRQYLFQAYLIEYCLHYILNLGALEIYDLLGYYAASCGNYLPTFRDNVSVPSSRVKIPSRRENM